MNEGKKMFVQRLHRPGNILKIKMKTFVVIINVRITRRDFHLNYDSYLTLPFVDKKSQDCVKKGEESHWSGDLLLSQKCPFLDAWQRERKGEAR
jgi:hypothetical protein